MRLQLAITFRLKGSYYYEANRLFNQQRLSAGKALSIHLEPNNPFDPNALKIYLPQDHPPIHSSHAHLLQVPIPHAAANVDYQNTQWYPAGWLLGYAPKSLAKLLAGLFRTQFQQNHYSLNLQKSSHSLNSLQFYATLTLNPTPWQAITFLVQRWRMQSCPAEWQSHLKFATDAIS